MSVQFELFNHVLYDYDRAECQLCSDSKLLKQKLVQKLPEL